MISIREHVFLAPFTSVKIGGPARFFVETKTKEEVKEALHWALERHTPYVVLGAGSNVLVADKGFGGLAVRMCFKELSFEGEYMYADAGVSMAQAAARSLQQNLSGFEWAAGIPGTVGGSVYGNAGCFGGEMQQVLERVRVLECKVLASSPSRSGQSARLVSESERAKCKVVEFKNADCMFAYRESIFKKRKDWIILGATLKLKQVSDEEKKEKQAWIQQMMRDRVMEQAIGERTIGSTFKGIPLTDETMRRVRSYDVRFAKRENSCWVFESRRGMISAGFLIEQAGLKGKKIGGVSVSPKHANFLVSDGTATAEHVVMLIAYIKEYVHRKFGVMLGEEIQYISSKF
ncbi:MAG: UDP-N-acetylmuramate dehydrogenase [Parcubacteria group bacterium Gr01-1014_70]|nr:MAG: UDP-N-acetylmuramate dehydrogenase [Parcubacteria group bacterium Gr01-1014_70]